MSCPQCGSVTTQEQPTRISLGYRTFRCVVCGRRFNERSGTPFNDMCVPTNIVFLVVPAPGYGRGQALLRPVG